MARPSGRAILTLADSRPRATLALALARPTGPCHQFIRAAGADELMVPPA